MSNFPKHIVIIGGGYCGIRCAQVLEKKLKSDVATITIIEKQEFAYHTVGTPRALVDPSYWPKLFIPHQNAFTSKRATVAIVHGKAEEIQGNNVLVRKINRGQLEEETSAIQFDYLVIATGSSYPSPIKVDNNIYIREDVENALEETYNHIKSASSVLVIGGGAVGCEVAGEIATAYPEKKITLLDSNTSLISSASVSEKFRTKLHEALTRLNVHVILGEKLPERLQSHSFEKKSAITDKGTTIESDVQLVCAGASPNVDIINKLDPSLISKNRAIRVKMSLQLDDDRFQNIFVVGDASDHPTPKLAYYGGLQAAFLGNQLISAILHGTKVEDCTGVTDMVMMVPVGPNHGATQFPFFGGFVLGDFITKHAKGKDYFASKTWSSFGATVPVDNKDTNNSFFTPKAAIFTLLFSVAIGFGVKNYLE